MTTRGRKPKPTALRLVEGNAGKRALPTKEAKPKVLRVTPPAHLGATAKAEWKRVADELFNCGLLSSVDRAALAAYCQSYARWVEAEKAVAKLAKDDPLSAGLMIRTSNGNLVQNPMVGTANKAMADMMKYAAEFGMTPSARSRINVEGAEDDDETAQFFARG